MHATTYDVWIGVDIMVWVGLQERGLPVVIGTLLNLLVHFDETLLCLLCRSSLSGVRCFQCETQNSSYTAFAVRRYCNLISRPGACYTTLTSRLQYCLTFRRISHGRTPHYANSIDLLLQHTVGQSKRTCVLNRIYRRVPHSLTTLQ